MRQNKGLTAGPYKRKRRDGNYEVHREWADGFILWWFPKKQTKHKVRMGE